MKKDIQALKSKAAEMIGKKIEMNTSIKALSIDEKNFTATFVMSTEAIDRHGEIVDQATWMLEFFKMNPIAFFSHDSRSFPVGQWFDLKLEADPSLLGKQRLVGTYKASRDDEGFIGEDVERIWRHIKIGDLNMVSVGFIPHRVDYDEARDAFVLYDCELIECSIVGIGSNRYALIKEAKDIKDIQKSVIEARNALDAKVKASDNTMVIAHLKALEDLSRAARRLNV